MNVNKLASLFERSRSFVRRHSYISVDDDTRLSVERCIKVKRFEDDLIELVLAKNNIVITGLELSMKNYAYDSVMIYGKIHSVTFEEREE